MRASHLLLGVLACEPEGPAAELLAVVGVNRTESRNRILRDDLDPSSRLAPGRTLGFYVGGSVQGLTHWVVGSDGARTGLLTAGVGPALLLVHGGMGTIELWEPMWAAVAERWRVTAMDRRGRGSSGDHEPYALSLEYDDIVAAATHLVEDGGLIDAFGHSYGATCVLGAATRGAPFRRITLYDPPGPPTESIERVTALISEGKPGRVMFSFLTEIIGLTAEQFEELNAAPRAYDVLAIVSATMLREARALSNGDLCGLAVNVAAPVLLLLGATSPPWAGDVTRSLMATLPNTEHVVLANQGMRPSTWRRSSGQRVTALPRQRPIDPGSAREGSLSRPAISQPKALFGLLPVANTATALLPKSGAHKLSPWDPPKSWRRSWPNPATSSSPGSVGTAAHT